MMIESEISRRTLVSRSIGYAAAVLPITAWAINTPENNLLTGTVQIPSGKDKLPAYFARPKTAGPHPCILVIQEIFGVHEYIKDVCRRLANLGYYAIAPDLYFRYGDATKISDIPKLRSEIVSKVALEDVMKDLDATREFLRTQTGANVKKTAITGFCWGGGITWMYSARTPELQCGVAWYGRLTGDSSPQQQKFPLDVVGDLKVPVLGLYGGKDQGIPLDQVEKMRTVLKAKGEKSRIDVFPEADHGFHADYRPSYNEKAAQLAWAKMLEWFDAHGMKV